MTYIVRFDRDFSIETFMNGNSCFCVYMHSRLWESNKVSALCRVVLTHVVEGKVSQTGSDLFIYCLIHKFSC